MEEKNSSNVKKGTTKLQSLRRRLQDPSLIRRFQREYASTKIMDTTDKDCDGMNSLDTTTTTILFGLLREPWLLVESTETQSSHTTAPHLHGGETKKYPTEDRLTIRQAQNEGFCRDCLEQGVAAAKQGNAKQAQIHYQQGLDLMPQHVDLLVAMGALLANQQKFNESIQRLQQAVTLDPQHATAKEYLSQVQAAAAARSSFTKTSKSAAARQDVLMEQSLLLDKGKRKKDTATSTATGATLIASGEAATTKATSGTEQYELLPDSSDEEESRKHSKRKKRKEKKKRKKRRKRRKRDEYDSEDSLSDASSSTSSLSSYDRRRRKKRRRRKRSKRSDRTDEESLASSSQSNGTVNSLKLVSQKLKHDPSRIRE